jgi:hypothetical protein
VPFNSSSRACRKAPIVSLALGCGKIRNKSDRTSLRARFDTQGWELWDEPWLRERLRQMAKQGYENQVSAVVAKLLLREKVARVGAEI